MKGFYLEVRHEDNAHLLLGWLECHPDVLKWGSCTFHFLEKAPTQYTDSDYVPYTKVSTCTLVTWAYDPNPLLGAALGRRLDYPCFITKLWPEVLIKLKGFTKHESVLKSHV